MIIWIIVFIILVLLILGLALYNSFVKAQNRVEEAFSTMDVYLKKRWDLIPNLVEVVKGYAKHEKNTLTEIVELRSKVYDNMSNTEKLESNAVLTEDISKLMILAENYPQLKANENFLNLSGQIMKVEDEIANSRKYYNGTVRIFNNKVLTFPSNIIAKIFGFKEQKMFSSADEERNNVDVNL